MVQLVGIQLKLRLPLKDNVVLIYLRVHRADLPLAKGVIQSVIDRCRRNTEPRRGDPVDHQIYCEASGLLIGGDVFEFRQLSQLVDEAICPII